ncbi:hypothetical protein NMY22_g3098 [Coprinellus aureogranulatus]|nr:hypothetical protein NMY22_g3098 [Coprinellus aureogranulatus]
MTSLSSFSSSSILDPNYGAHPSIVTTIQLPELQPDSACSLLLHYTLPPLLFVDKYELEMRSGEYQVVGLRGRGAKELEKPVHALQIENGGDSAVGVELAVRKDLETQADTIQVRLPIHVRYGEPVASNSSAPYTIQGLESPSVVLACSDGVPSCNSHSEIPNYLRSFAEDSIYAKPYCTVKSSAPQPLEISVPLGNTVDIPVVEISTSAVILACFVWIALEAWRTSRRLRAVSVKNKDD